MVTNIYNRSTRPINNGMLGKENVKNALDTFGFNLKKQSRANLTRKGVRDTNKLYESLEYETKVSKNSIEFDFLMSEHGLYQDKGVRGAGGVRKTTSKFNRRNNKGKLWKIKAKDSPYRFREKKPPLSALSGWAKSRGLNPYAVREAVYRQGIEPTYFFTRAVETQLPKLIDNLGKDYGDDLENFINITVK